MDLLECRNEIEKVGEQGWRYSDDLRLERGWAKMTERQKELIEGMNEFCTGKCLLDADV